MAIRFRAPWPNPSHGLVRFGLELARPTVVTVTVLDVAGREVARPIAGERFDAGKVTREWRPAGLAPGVYAVRATLGGREAHPPAGLVGRGLDAPRGRDGAGPDGPAPPRSPERWPPESRPVPRLGSFRVSGGLPPSS